ncbi:MAG: NAD(+)/NADH kinase [Peptococcaceae bacterium]|jgi:predicted polyphosphate/ATP-dependent NAD kinase|nr:NAD(+)/NADH kinase [Peptococcaceae bacterium]MDH7524679.1 NAD(+)/NADH kinase [Peptococcaceae bacterium]
MPTVGIIANPASGKDIRRLVAYGTVFDNLEKVNIVRRILLGLAAAGVNRAVYMPDYFGIVPKAVEGLYSEHRLSMEIVPADIRLTGTQVDSYEAALEMGRWAAGCIITLGGDGTNRMVAKGCGDTPLLPVSTGTNNVFPRMVEGTIAGLAAGAVACGKAGGPQVLNPSKKLVIYKNGEPVDIALIDAVVLKDKFIGSRAMWEVDSLRQAVVTRGEAHNIGIASIAGNLAPVGVTEKKGMVLEFDPEKKDVLAPIAPGLIVPVGIKRFRLLEVGERVEVDCRPCIIALDGEREVELKESDEAYIELTFDGPRVVDVKAALKTAVENNYSRCRARAILGSE